MPELQEAPVGKKKYARHGQSLHVYIPPLLRAAIGEASRKHRRDLTAEVEIAIEQYLEKLGMWPPDAEDN